MKLLKQALACGVVLNPQFHWEFWKKNKSPNTLDMLGSSLPASITNTVKDSSVSRLAKTPAAVPPPTIIKSKVPKPTKLCNLK